MRVGNARDIGQMIRTARLQAGMRQSDLARVCGTTQGWLSELENGKPRAELDLALRVLRELGFTLELGQDRRNQLSAGPNERFDAASLVDFPSSRAVMDQSDDGNENNGGR